MSAARNSSMLTVRRGASWRAHKTFYAFVGIMTALLVYQWGWIKAERSEPRGEYTASATVRYPTVLAGNGAGEASAVDGHPDFAAVRQHICAAANVERAVRVAESWIAPLPQADRAAAIQRAVDEVRQTLRVSVSPTLTPNETQAAIAWNSHDPQLVVTLVNILAAQHAEDCRAAWNARVQKAYTTACDASQRAQHELAEVKARLETFLQKSPDPHESPSVENGQAAADNPPAQANPPEPTTVENPAWLSLTSQLGQLEQQRAELLQSRNSAHPAVVDIDGRIADMKGQLAQIPRTNSVRPADAAAAAPDAESRLDSAPASSLPTVRPPVDETKHETQLAEQRHNLRGAVSQAEEARDAAERVEQQALQACRQVPLIDVQLSHPIEITPPPTPGVGLVLAAVCSALAVVGGVMLVCAGVAMEPPLRNVAEVEAVLPVPVVGVIRTGESACGAKAKRHCSPLLRLSAIVGGLTLIGACLGTAWMAV